MNILIDKIRIKNFRALHNVELSLKPITLLVGANNSGKTSLLRALNTVLGISRTQLNKDDLFIDKDSHQPENSIIIDIHMVPTDNEGKRVDDFIDNKITGVFGGAPNISNNNGQEFFAFRTEYVFENEDTPKNPEFTIIRDWENGILDNPGEFKRIAQVRNAFKMYFIDAQRDLEEEAKLRGSFFGKLASQLESSYSEGDIPALQELIEKLNEEAVGKSDILSHLKMHLEKLNQTTQSSGEGVSISPFPKKIRDLHKGMKVDFQDNGSDTFGMEYHGMGTRSWASMLTVGAYIDWELKSVKDKEDNGEAVEPLFPMLALEEPEAHLHPNAQRTLYSQLKDFKGQKIISTHSPYIAGQADLTELRHFYKAEDKVEISQIDLSILDNKDIERIQNDIESSQAEVLFTNIVVMCEGETEEFALPTFAKHYFGKSPFELGILFVKTGKFYPLLTLLKFLKVQWFIFSDYDKPDVKTALQNTLNKNNVTDDTVIKLNDDHTEKDFEEYLYDEGYIQELKEALKKIKEPAYANEQHRQAKQAEVDTENQRIDALSKEDFLNELSSWKVKASKIYPSLILNRNKINEQIPSKIKDLFDKINAVLNSSNNPNT